MFRKANGHSLDELPYRAAFGVYGSWVTFAICALALIAQFYVALFPVGGAPPDAKAFFEAYMAAPFLVVLYLGWKIYSWIYIPEHRPLWVAIKDIDIYTGMRHEQRELISGQGVDPDTRRASIQEIQDEKKVTGVKGRLMAVVHAIF